MPKTNHSRQFTDDRDYSCFGDWACGKHGSANNRRGAKKGLNRINRTRQNQAVKNAVKNDDIEEFLPLRNLRGVGKAHDYNGKSQYVEY